VGLYLDVELCDGTQTPADGGTCASVTRSRGGGSLVFTYDTAQLTSWWNINQGLGLQSLYDQTMGGSSETVTVKGYGCFCFEPRFVQGGKFFLKVGGLDRNSWEEATYTVKTAFTAYPKSFVAVMTDGGVRSCPQVNDAGTPVDAGVPDGGTDGGTPDAGPPPPRGGCDFTR
jgi:hypothetical protein